MSEMSFQDEINALNAEAQQINEQIMKFNFKLENHQNNFKKAEDEAQQNFGTKNFDELYKIAQNIATENDRKKEEYKQAIEKKKEEVREKVRLEREITEGNV